MDRISVEGINGVAWTLNTIAIVLTGGRIYLRAKLIKHLGWDDVFHCLALLFSIAQIAIYTSAKSLNSSISKYETGEITTVPNFTLFMQLNVAATAMFFCCIWAVKLAFMIFYRHIFSISAGFMRAWWAVLVFVILSFWVCFAGILVPCGGNASHLLDIAICTSTSSVKLQRIIFKFSFAMNVSSDIAIMLLPLVMIRTFQMRPAQKIGVIAIFSLSLVIIAFEILRIVKSLEGTGESLNVLWTNIETSIAVIISCMPTYNSLISTRRKEKVAQNAANYEKLAASRNKKIGTSATGDPSNLHNHIAHDVHMDNFNLEVFNDV